MTLQRFAGRQFFLLALMAALVSLVLVACDDDDATSAQTSSTSTMAPSTAITAPTEAADELSGSLNIEGSSTVAPYTRLAVEAFEALHNGVTVTTGEVGSGGGITAWINGDVPIAAASRQISDDEVSQAEAAGLTVHETKIFDDALVIVVHPDNPVESLTVEQVARIFAGEITDWSEVGGAAGAITLYTRNEESGTFAYLEEEVIQEVLGDDAEYAADINKQANAPAGLTAVSGDTSGIFYAGLGNIADIPAGTVKAVPIAAEEGGEAVEASEATVASGDYPIARGLYYYTDGDPAASDDPLVAAFIAFVLSPEGQALGEELGFVPVN